MPSPDYIRPLMIVIPEGEFMMGSENGPDNEAPVHRVWVDSFAIAQYPVTRLEYSLFIAKTGHEPPPFWQDPRFQLPGQPVVGPSWYDAVAYCEWLSDSTGNEYRLPTEAEREKAARGGLEQCDYPWGNQPPADPKTRPEPPLEEVGTEGPNGYGLYNMSVGVHEWCADYYDASYYDISPDRNPTGPGLSKRRAARGGAWRHAVRFSRCAARSSLAPGKQFNDFGFRCAMTVLSGSDKG